MYRLRLYHLNCPLVQHIRLVQTVVDNQSPKKKRPYETSHIGVRVVGVVNGKYSTYFTIPYLVCHTRATCLDDFPFMEDFV